MTPAAFANAMREIGAQRQLEVAEAVVLVREEFEPAETLVRQVVLHQLWRRSGEQQPSGPHGLGFE